MDSSMMIHLISTGVSFSLNDDAHVDGSQIKK